MNNKTLATLFVGKIKSILKSTEQTNQQLTKDKDLDNPIMADVILSNKAAAYDSILNEYKLYIEKKKKLKDDEG